MINPFLPRFVERVGVPPIKIQGIKTKLVPFILANIEWNGKGRWIEPFLGSGVVAFNVAPQSALLCDSNIHIINFYKAIQDQSITVEEIESFLQEEGKKLSAKGVEHFYAVRERFNKNKSPLDFLFLNRSCFNGVIRFNGKGLFNTPFGHKPERFSRSYITKICNQVRWIAKQMKDKDWEFAIMPWRLALDAAHSNDFAYLDPPYIGRHTDYFNCWSEKDAEDLATEARQLKGGFALSMWLENKYRKNEHIAKSWSGNVLRSMTHFYHVGSTEDLRNYMEEALVIKPGYATRTPVELGVEFASEQEEIPTLFSV
ncbi:MAG TPA: Dam family site-specific DNA-(adenine-N6)-methyltransferase [Candidatus Kapabacteria bacterium]|jgi:DNA adenine methylase|nr:Dam family site-specific DNA-(adenine-N6)-methyltransferase [Candidatus Kapabacteria bacterium]